VSKDSPDFLAATDVAPLFAGILSIAAFTNTVTQNFTPPAAATAVAVLVFGYAGSATVTVQGLTSLSSVQQTLPLGGVGTTFVFPLQGDVEASISVAVALSSNNPGPGPLAAAAVSFYLGAGFTYVQNPPNQPLSISPAAASLFIAEHNAAQTILGGSQFAILTPGVIIIVIPAGRTWEGTVGVKGSLVANNSVDVITSGVGANPVAGTTLAGIATGAAPSGSTVPCVSPNMRVSAPPGNSVNLRGVATVAASGAACWADGVLL
jgi:hypothetical protein